MMEKEELESIMEFMLHANKVKEIKRTGWVLNKVENPEHVGDHQYSTALLSYLIGKAKGLDAGKCMAMGLIHDVTSSHE